MKLCIAAWLANALTGLPSLANASLWDGAALPWQKLLALAGSVAIVAGAFSLYILISKQARPFYLWALLGIGPIVALWAIFHSVGVGARDWIVYPIALLVMVIGVTNPWASDPYND